MKRGFTLIELLAVIVILAIIALIAAPIVINIINDSKYESQKRSIDLYAKALEQSVADYQLKNNKKVEGKFNTTDGKILTRDDTTLNVDYKGNVVCNRIIINKDGSIYLSECTVDGDKVYISKEESNKEKPKYYEYGKTEYGMIMENKSHSNKFLNTGILGSKIYQFSISNTLEINDKEIYESADCSYNKDRSVICYWKELEEKTGYYNMILASDGEMYTPVDSSYLFYCLGYQIDNFVLDLTNLNTLKTTNMSHMFENIGGDYLTFKLGNKFDTSKVNNMSHMFKHSFWGYTGTLDFLNKFDTSNVTDMSYMFSNDFYDFNGEFKFPENFDTSNVTDMSYMFANSFRSYSCSNANLNLGENFDTSKVTNMSGMFQNMGAKRLDVGSKFDTSKVTNMSGMFSGIGMPPQAKETSSYGCMMKNLDLKDKFDTSKVTNMARMFYGINYLESINFGTKFNTKNVTDMSWMFSSSFNKSNKGFVLPSEFDTSNVTNMYYMFSDFGKNIIEFDLGNSFDTSNVINMSNMFRGSFKNNLKVLNLKDKFDTSNVTDMSYMFEGAGYEGLEEIKLGNSFDTSSVKFFGYMFKNMGYNKLKKLDLGGNFVRGNKYNYYEYRFDNMFEGAGHESMTELNLRNFQFYRSYDYYRGNIFKDCGSEGVLNKVIVSNNELKGWLKQLTSPKDVPDFWKASDGAIIQVQAS